MGFAPSSPARYVKLISPQAAKLTHVFYLLCSFLCKGACFAGGQRLLSVDAAENLNQFCDHAGPSGLMAEACAVIAMEVLVEQDANPSFNADRSLEFFHASVDRPPSRFIASGSASSR